jgi:hypothetical protein
MEKGGILRIKVECKYRKSKQWKGRISSRKEIK